ncbi:MAG: carbohydrate ABC transporter permease [Anaerolineae bacterium]|nr:carbohydrate ABC transporter permease [Anaerolineae bacterium]
MKGTNVHYARKRESIFGRYRLRHLLGRAIIYTVLISLSIVYLLPLFWMISTSLKPAGQVTIYPVKWIPDPVRWQNYVEAWNLYPFTKFTFNSLFIVIMTVIGAIASCTLIAYGFGRVRFRGRNVLFFVLLSSMMLPGAVTMIPVYVLFAKLSWVDTYKPLIVPSYFGSAYYVFFLRQFMMSLPLELDEAARIDGAGHLTTLTRVILPLIKPPLVAVGIFTAFDRWNDFFGPLLYLSSREKFTFVLALRALQVDTVYGSHYEWLMALSLIQLAPMITIYFLAQRYFIEGLSITGVRG